MAGTLAAGMMGMNVSAAGVHSGNPITTIPVTKNVLTDGNTMAPNTTFEFEVAPNEKFIVYVHVVDKAGNDIYLSSNGVIVDDKLPEVINNSPEIDIALPTANANGIYNKDDTVKS